MTPASRIRHKNYQRCTTLFMAAVAASMATASPSVPPKKSKDARPSLYVIGYSHLDTQWCWSYPQVIREFIPNTLHENFALFDKYPDYVFNWTGSNRYRFMKEYYPSDYAKLKKYVAEGKWFPAGSSIEEGDVNSPSEESLIRQVMYGNEFFRKEFGKQSNEYMLPDCFGFPASLPSILAHCGLKGFSTQKLTWGSAVGIPFNVGKWVGPDGKYIVAALNADAYDSDVRTDLANDANWVKRLDRDATKDGVAVDYHYYGVGDRGGAPDEQSVKNVQMSMKAAGPVKVFSGRADQMFNDLTPEETEKLPIYKGDLELTQHSAGSLSSEGAMKRWNRKNELLGNATESASVAANWLGSSPYDKSRITDAWLRFLPGQFHDLMAGTALPVAYTYTWNDEILAMNEFAGVLEESVGAVTRTLNTNTQGVPLSVYNPLSVDRHDVIEANVKYPGELPINVSVYDASGTALPAQVVSRGEHSIKVLFVGKVPSFGYAVFDIRPSSEQPEVASDLKVTENGLENSRYSVKINAAGDVSSVFDKKNNKELLSAPARLAYMHENPSQFPAWNMDWNDQKKAPEGYVTGAPTVRIVDQGPVRVSLRITRRENGSKFIQTLRLGSGDSADRLDFDTHIDWQGKECALKAEFPLTVSNPKATYNWGLGTIQRGNDEPRRYEVASHGWMDLTNPDNSYGASILDDCKYGSDKPNDNTLRLTLIYTPGVRGGYQHQATQDWGRNVMTYSLTGHSGSWTSMSTQWQSAELNQPLLAFQSDKHSGVEGTSLSLAHTSTPDVSIEALKQAEDSDEVVVRLNELAGKDHPGTEISFAAPITSAREIDGQERPIGKGDISNGHLVVDVKSYEPRAFAIKLGRAPTAPSAVASHPLSLPYNAVGISSGFGAKDGNFDGSGKSLPGDLVPAVIESDGIQFKTGPKGANNVLIPQGQTIALPAGTHRKMYVLGASAGADVTLPLDFGVRTGNIQLQSWNGYIGQWDSRLWGGEVPELTYDWHNPNIGLVPGFIKRQSVAWYADHTRLPNGDNDPYAFCYLFRSVINVPDSAKQVVLPNDANARIASITIAENPNELVSPAQPLYDELERGGVDGPSISVDASNPNAEQIVSIAHPLYWNQANPIRYTLDGSTPTLSSSTYMRPFAVGKSGQLTVAELDSTGKVLGTNKATLQVSDSTAPTIVSVVSLPSASIVKLQFSEEVDRTTAENAANYTINPGVTVNSAKLSDDGKSVTLSLTGDPAVGAAISVNGVKEMGGNAISAQSPITTLQPVYSMDAVQNLDGKGDGVVKGGISNLPASGKAPWTMNMYLNPDSAPGNLTMIGGFGSGDDSSRAERFIVYFHNHWEFWGSNVDIESGQSLEPNKWQMISVTFDGKKIRLYKDGEEIKSENAELNDAEPTVRLAPPPAWDEGHRFAGKVAGFSVWGEALSPSFIKSLTSGTPKS